ncbi:MAG: YraN family protein [Paludibacteraceae bacterium]|nr:YraN family protein [Paludibacteraceae bacterium]
MFVTNPIGIIGEEEAAKILKKKGFKILEHNWRMGHLEVDLIAENRKEIVFVEVKARTCILNGKMPEENVDEIKQRRITAAANAYIKYHKIDKKPRFDVAGFLVDRNTKEITYSCYLENAFQPQIRTISSGSYSGKWRWFHRGKTIGSKH